MGRIITIYLLLLLGPLEAHAMCINRFQYVVTKESPLEEQFNRKNTTYIVKQTIDLHGITIVMPKGCRIVFENEGTIVNGTIILENTELDGAKNLECKVEGIIKNDTIQTSWFKSFSNTTLEYSNKVILFDHDENVTKSILLFNCKHAVFNGNSHAINNIGCDLFQIEGDCSDIEVKFFKTDGDGKQMFFGGNSTNGIKENIKIHHNVINDQRVGISLNADLAGSYLNCSIHDNVISNIIGEETGHGYGIHLANVNNTDISNNIIDNCERHAIYHAWGENNIIQGNTIRNHRKNTQFAIRAALAIFRNSCYVKIQDNTFENNHSVDVHFYTGVDSQSSYSHRRYGDQRGNIVCNNTFIHDELLNSKECIGIMVGYNVLPYDDYRYYINNLKIEGNRFTYTTTNAPNCIRIYYCDKLEILNNEFQFDNSVSGDLVNFSSKYKQNTENKWFFEGNIIVAKNSFRIPINIIYISPDWYENQGGVTIEVNGNSLVNNKNGETYNYRLYSNQKKVSALKQRD